MRCPNCGEHRYSIVEVCCPNHAELGKGHKYSITMWCSVCQISKDYFEEAAEKVKFVYNDGNRMGIMKFAIDIHGVIDTNPKFFRRMCKSLVRGGMEVHVLTGKHIANGIKEELAQLGFLTDIHYTHLFSISDFHKERGTPMWGDTKNPYMDDQVWNNTKALYCKLNHIDFCLDDKEEYMKDFLTPVALYKSHTMHLTNDPKKPIIKDQETMNE